MKFFYFKILFVTIVAQEEELFNLNIIHYNDFHAHYDEVSPSGGTCDAAQSCIGGLSRLSAAIREALEAEPDSLLLNGGDTFQGTVWYNFLRWNVSQHFMNLLPKHDAHVLGNHEFSHGLEGLLPYLERLAAPMLGANVNTTQEPEFGQYIKNHIVVERNNRRIGIIGVLLKEFTGDIGQLKVEDELRAINREAAALANEGVDIIIVLSHVGYPADVLLASMMSSEVDIIVGAHSHTVLYSGDAPFGEPVGPYPTVITQNNGHRILIVQAACYTQYLGNIRLQFNKEGKIVSWDGQPIFLGPSIIKDERMEEALNEWRAELYPLSREVLGRALVPLDPSPCYYGECNLGSWICDAYLEQMMPLANDSEWNSAHACLLTVGGLRARINAGEITTEGLLMALPFENQLQAFDIKGQYIMEALEYSVSAQFTGENKFGSRRMLQVGGMRVVVNASRASGSRVVSARVRCATCAVPRYQPLDPQALYTVVTQNYLGDGGGGFTMLSENRENVVDFGDDYKVLQNHMRKTKIFYQELDGRIQIVY